MPHDNGFAISLVERIEDLVTIVLLPIVSLFLMFTVMLLNFTRSTLPFLD
jgi:hypothetical protein